MPRPEDNGMEENAHVEAEQLHGQHDRQLHEEVGQQNRGTGALVSAEDSNLEIQYIGYSDAAERNVDDQANSE